MAQAVPVERPDSLAQVAHQAPAELVEQAVLPDPQVMAETAALEEPVSTEPRAHQRLVVHPQQPAATAAPEEPVD